MRGLALAVPEAIGIAGVICPPEAPLLGLISTTAPLIACGNRVVAVASDPHPLSALDFYQVLETSDVPAGVLNIVTGDAAALGAELAKHNGVDTLWAFGSAELSQTVESLSTGNLKRVFTDYGRAWDWSAPETEGEHFVRQSTQVKNIWVPYGSSHSVSGFCEAQTRATTRVVFGAAPFGLDSALWRSAQTDHSHQPSRGTHAINQNRSH